MEPRQIGWSQESILLWGVSRELERLGGLVAGGLGAVNSLTTLGNAGPASLVDGVLNIPVYTSGGGSPGLTSASNGLSISPPGNVILGGPLTGNTTITVGAFLLALTGNTPTSVLRVTNSSATVGSHGIQGVSGGASSYGVSGVNTGSGSGIYAESNTGAAISAVSQQGQIVLTGTVTPVDNSSISPMIRIFRDSQSQPVVGIGAGFEYYIKTDTSAVLLSNRLTSRWTNVITSQRTSEFVVQGVLTGTTTDLFTLSGNGLARLNHYGLSQPPGNTAPVFALNIDNAGRIVQVPIPVSNLDYLGTPVSGTITNSNGTGTPIPIVTDSAAGLMSSPQLSRLLSTEIVANKQNSMVVDGTGTKYPTVDATNIFGNNILKVTANTGFIDRLDSFNMVLTDANTITITGSNPGAFVRTLLFAPPPIPAQAVVNISSRVILASSITLPGPGRYYRFLGYDYATDTIINSPTSYILVDNIVQLGYVEMFQTGGVNSFTILQMEPDLSTTSLFESVMIANQTTVKILPNTDLTVKNTDGEIRGHNINKGAANPHVKLFPASASALHINLDPSYLTTSTGFNPTVAVNVSNYWNGTALVQIPSPNNATIQRWILTLAGRLYLQAGDTVYATKAGAEAALSSVVFQDILPKDIFIEICRMVATKNAIDLTDTTKVSFSYSGGGAGGSATPTPIFTIDNPGLVPAPLTQTSRFLADNGQWLSPTAFGFTLDANVVHKTGNLAETITGAKTFSTGVIAPSYTIPGGLPTQILLADGTFILTTTFSTDASVVHRTGNLAETVTGVKTFSAQITAPGYAIPAAPVDTVLLANGGIAPFKDIISGGQTELLTWKFLTATTATDPGANQFKMNNVTPSLVTQIYVNDITNVLGADISALFAKIKGDWFIHIQATGDATKYVQYTSNVAYTDNLGWWTLPVTFVQGTGFPINNAGATTWVMINQNSGGAPNTLLFSGTDYNLPASSALQKAFNAPDDTVTLDVGVYRINWLFGVRNLSNANTNISIGFLGTAANLANTIKFSCNSRKSNNPDIPTIDSGQSFQQGLLNNIFSITEFNNRSKAAFALDGIIRVLVPGTLIPAVSSTSFNTGTAMVEDRQLFQITKIEI